MRRRIAITVTLTLVAAALAVSQAAPARLRISGKAVNAITGQPLANAEVSIARPEEPNIPVQRLLTAEDGAFTFNSFEPGKYLLVGQAPGFRKQGYEQHGIYVSAVAVGRGIVSDNIVFRLRPDAAIEGTVIDQESEAVANASVTLFRTDASAGIRQTFQVAQEATDDRGYYRFSHLESGWYYIVVSAQPWFGGFAQQRQASGSLSQSERNLLDSVYPTTFYPGVSDAASASQIALNEGHVFTADFTLDAVPAIRVRIHHMNIDPQQPRGATLEQKIFGARITLPSQGQVNVDDSVEITGVPPGHYVLDMRSYGSAPWSSSQMISVVSDMDIEAEAASAAASITGTMLSGGAPVAEPWPLVRLWNKRTNEILDAQPVGNGDFQFDTHLLESGTYSVFAVRRQYSVIETLSATGAKVVGQSFQIGGASQIHLKIELSRTLSHINGTAFRQGTPVSGAMIILVPENAESNVALFRRDQSDSDGTFTLPEVVPGRYKILALEDAWDLEWADLALIKNRLDHARTLEVRPNTTSDLAVEVK
jgi:protocatechuate 3,4-dioxygenase beta subunit